MTPREQEAAKWLDDAFAAALPLPDRRPLWQWAEEHVKLPFSLRAERFDMSLTPWLREPAEWITDGVTKELTLIKAVQGAGSTLGEIAIPYWLCNDPGPLMYNWETDDKAKEIWDERTSELFEKCGALNAVLSAQPKNKRKRAHVVLPGGHFFIQQGVNARKKVQSKSIRYLVNEEVWDWEAGRLDDARKRVTASWNSFVLNISQGSIVNDQLDRAHKDGTMHELEAACPFCGHYQQLSFDRPRDGKAGGLYFDSSKKRDNGEYDFPELLKTVGYQCEKCEQLIHDEPRHRRSMAMSCRYVQTNPDAPAWRKSAHYNALIVEWIPWATLVEEYLKALRALRFGDVEPIIEFDQKRKAVAYDPEKRPMVTTIKVIEGLSKREPLPDATDRYMTVDVQQDHFWVVIRDWRQDACRLLFEGKVRLVEDIESLRIEYETEARYVLMDSGYKATEVYQICARYGYTAIKGEDRGYYIHEVTDLRGRVLGKERKVFSPLQYVDPFIGTKDQNRTKVVLMLYSKQGIRDRWHHLVNAEGFSWETPGDVSEDYKLHMQSEELRDWHKPRTGERFKVWFQVRKRNDLFVCECYQVLLADICGIIGAAEIIERPDRIEISTT